MLPTNRRNQLYKHLILIFKSISWSLNLKKNFNVQHQFIDLIKLKLTLNIVEQQ